MHSPLHLGPIEDERRGVLKMRDRFQDFRRAMHSRLTRIARDETGATAVEYAVMVGLIAAVIILVVQALGIETVNAFQSVLDAWP